MKALDVAAWSTRHAHRYAPQRATRLRERELLLALFHLGHLLAGGVPLSNALEELVKMESRLPARLLWQSVQRQIDGGQALSAALAQHPRAFPELLVVLVRSGETTGNLAEALEAAEKLLSERQDRRSRLLTALTYPVFAFVVVIACTVFLLLSVVPVLADTLRAMAAIGGQALPWHTELLVAMSNGLGVFVASPLPIVLPALGFIAIVFGRRSAQGRRYIDRFLQRLPLIGEASRQLALATYSATWARLADAGVAHPEAMSLAGKTVTNRHLGAELEGARAAVANGASLTRAFGDRDLPSLFLRMVHGGAESGQLSVTLERAAVQLHALADHRVRRLEALTGPLLMLLVALVLIALVVSLLMPLQTLAGELPG